MIQQLHLPHWRLTQRDPGEFRCEVRIHTGEDAGALLLSALPVLLGL